MLIVLVPRSNVSVRLCGDIKVTKNSDLQIDKYSISKLEEFLAVLKKVLSLTYPQVHVSATVVT